MKKDNWTEDIGRRLKDYECDAPQGLWESLDEAISDANAPLRKAEPHRWIWALPVTAFAFAAAAALFVILKPVQVQSELPSSGPILSDNDTTTEPIIKQSDYIALADTFEPITAAPSLSTEPIEYADTAIKGSAGTPVAEQTDSANETTVTRQQEGVKENDGGFIDINDWEKTDVKKADRRTDRRLALNLYGSGSAGSRNSTVSQGFVSAGIGSEGMNWIGDPEIGIALYNQGLETINTTRHHLPVRIGAGLSFSFAPHLSIGTGLEASILLSDFTDGTKQNYISSTQKLQYLGIPLDLRWAFFSSDRISLYAKAGVRLQKCVSASTEKDYVINESSVKKENERISEHPLQFSTQLALGAECRLWQRTGLYAEFEGGYYFDDGSQIQSIYHSRPLNCSLNFGIRVNITK